MVLSGVCFYQMHSREIGEANGRRRLMGNSANLALIHRFDVDITSVVRTGEQVAVDPGKRTVTVG